MCQKGTRGKESALEGEERRREAQCGYTVRGMRAKESVSKGDERGELPEALTGSSGTDGQGLPCVGANQLPGLESGDSGAAEGGHGSVCERLVDRGWKERRVEWTE